MSFQRRDSVQPVNNLQRKLEETKDTKEQEELLLVKARLFHVIQNADDENPEEKVEKSEKAEKSASDKSSGEKSGEKTGEKTEGKAEDWKDGLRLATDKEKENSQSVQMSLNEITESVLSIHDALRSHPKKKVTQTQIHHLFAKSAVFLSKQCDYIGVSSALQLVQMLLPLVRVYWSFFQR